MAMTETRPEAAPERAHGRRDSTRRAPPGWRTRRDPRHRPTRGHRAPVDRNVAGLPRRDRSARRRPRRRAPQDRHLQHPQPGQLRADAVIARRRRPVPVRHPDPHRHRHDRRARPGGRGDGRLSSCRSRGLLDVPHRRRHGRRQLPDQRRTVRRQRQGRRPLPRLARAWSSWRWCSRRCAWRRPSSVCARPACRSYECRCSPGRCSPPPRSGSPSLGLLFGLLVLLVSRPSVPLVRVRGRRTTSIAGCDGR